MVTFKICLVAVNNFKTFIAKLEMKYNSFVQISIETDAAFERNVKNSTMVGV